MFPNIVNIIYSNITFQVKVLTPPDDDERIPDFEDIFNENEVICY